jgi:hypothetical protein
MDSREDLFNTRERSDSYHLFANDDDDKAIQTLEFVDLPSDVMTNDILANSGFTEVYGVRDLYPEVYVERLHQPNELFLKFLSAIEDDNLELFQIAWEQAIGRYQPCYFIDKIILHLVPNVMANADTTVVPRKIFMSLLYQSYIRTLAKHLTSDYELFLSNIHDRQLIEAMIKYIARDPVLPVQYNFQYDENITQAYRQLKLYGVTPKQTGRYLRDMTLMLIGSLVAEYYPDMVRSGPMSDTSREEIFTARASILLELITDRNDSENGLDEDRHFAFSMIVERQVPMLDRIAGLVVYDEPPLDLIAAARRRAFSVDDAYSWYDALFDPNFYPELVKVTVYNDWFVFFEVIEGTLIRPDRFVDALFTYLNTFRDRDTGDILLYDLYILFDKIMEIPTRIYFRQNLESAALQLSTKTRRIVARRVLQWLDGTPGVGKLTRDILKRLTSYRQMVVEVANNFQESV